METIRLAELVAALSLGVDLGFGQPMEHVLRQSLIALHLADLIGLDDQARVDVYYTSLLLTVGCHSDAHEQAKWFGDDFALKATKFTHPGMGPRGAVKMVSMLGAGSAPLHRFRLGLEFVISGRKDVATMLDHHNQIARSLAERIGLPESVQSSLATAYEQWDGKGYPGKLRGSDVPLAARVATIAEFTEVAHRLGGIDAAVKIARKRGGKQFDPELAAIVCEKPEAIFDGLDSARTFDSVIAAEPALGVRLTDEQFEAALLAVANFVDIKSPYYLGHAPGVTDLVVDAGASVGITGAAATTLRRAALVHGYGRLGVSNAILDKAGALGAGERERVRMQPYLTERMLHQSPALAPLGALAVQHRERLDGSGYPHGLSGNALSMSARLLGAADAYQSMREPRPYRPALSADDAATEMRAEVRAGKLDADAVEAVLVAAGHVAKRRREGPSGLTAREVEVLRLVARGLPSKEIAAQLVISPKTARNHIEHIYTKIGVTSRVAASLYAVEQGLLPTDEFSTWHA